MSREPLMQVASFALMALALALIFLAATAPARAQVTCEAPDYSCQQTSSTTTGGITLASHCVRAVGRQNCTDASPLNECALVDPNTNCRQLTRECIDYVNGACRQHRMTYACLNEDGDMSPATLIRTEFGPVQERIISTCDDLEANATCSLASTRDTQGAEVRDINRRLFTRSWWQRERTYSCLSGGEGENNCGPLISNPTCALQGDTCLARRGGVCTNRQYHYRCGSEPGALQTSCQPVNVCVGETCLGIEQETTDEFGNSAAWLNLLAEMQREFRGAASRDPNDVRFFTGTRMTCSRSPGRNCCDDEGVLTGVLTCPESASRLADKRQAGATHYVGVTCQERVLGVCVKRRYHYCTYNSKFGRVFIEEFTRLTGRGWGPGPRQAECGYITIEDMANLDTEAMDFSPVFGDVMEELNLPSGDRIQSFFQNRFPNAGTDAQGVLTGGAP